MLERTSLVAYRKSSVTPDLAEALRQLEQKAAEEKLQLIYKGPPQGMTWKDFKPSITATTPALSMLLAGREVQLRVKLEGQASREEEISRLWEIALPLNFLPWNKYPLATGESDQIFHYLGKDWQPLFDSICSNGYGQFAWSSVCAAVLTDCGRYEGGKALEKFVQSQCHRLGAHCGIIDGIIGPRTLQALQSLGLTGLSLNDAAAQLSKLERAPQVKEKRRFGHVIVPGGVNVSSYGAVASTTTVGGCTLSIDGPGRVILDIT